MSNKALAATLFLTIAAGLVFAVWPDLDMRTASYFYRDNGFAGNSAGERLLRRIFYYAPIAIAGAMALAWLLGRIRAPIPPALVPASKSMIFILLSLLLAPGVLVNIVLKEHSARPRPVHVEQFGGKAEFRPWYRFDGMCRGNCSFVSGEVSASAWTAAPASLIPAPWRAPAMTAALAFAGMTGLLRMMFGGHFLSDAILAILLTLLICQLVHVLMFRKPKT